MTSQREAGDQYTARGKNLALLLLAMTQFVIVIDASIVNVALPSIGAHLHFARDDLSWVVNAYTLTFGGFLLLGGRMADLLGRRRMFIAGLAAVHRASLAGALGQSTGRSSSSAQSRCWGRHRPAGRALDHHDDLLPRAPNGTGRSESGARWPRQVAQSACRWAESSPAAELARVLFAQRPHRARRGNAGSQDARRKPGRGRGQDI